MHAGFAAVNKSILVRTGYGKESEQQAAGKLGSAIVVDDLRAAVDWIIGREAKQA